jgi:hypothetical protein
MTLDHDDIYCSVCGYPLCGLPAGRCPECGHHFDPADPASVRHDTGPIMRIHVANDLSEAEAFCHMLRESRIQARALGEGEGRVIGGTDRGFTIWVGRRHAQRAREIIAGQLEAARRLAQDRSAWNCPGCHEDIEGQFDTCWNCEAQRPEPSAPGEDLAGRSSTDAE